jgi:hypothetical protein
VSRGYPGRSGGKTSEGRNPKSVYGVKQSREGFREESRRQEAEKAWRRSAAGPGKPGVGRFPLPHTLKGPRTPREEAPQGAVRCRSYLGARRKFMRGFGLGHKNFSPSGTLRKTLKTGCPNGGKGHEGLANQYDHTQRPGNTLEDL